MPFVLRTVQPVYVSRAKLTGPDGKPLVQDYELEAVFNGTLCCAIRQLSSLLEAADDLFAGLTKEMTSIAERATTLQQRVRRVQERVDAHDPKLVTVPEGDLTAFSALPRDAHFHPAHLREPAKALFLADSRPAAVQRLYAAAARPTLDDDALAQLDRLRKDGARSSTLFLCTPTLGRTRTQRLRKKVVDIDIETRKPASVVELRRWTSTEALGDMTVHPDCTVRIAGRDQDDVDADASLDASEYLGVDSTVRPGDDQVDHQLPTTEEQVKAIAGRFPPEVVKVDVTGKPFTRMSRHRRSLLHPAGAGCGAASTEEEEARRRTRPRRQRSRRRNTIAGTDQKEIEEALHGDRSAYTNTTATVDDIILSSSSMIDSHPKGSKETTADFKKWAFNSLRRWGRSRFRAIGNSNSNTSTSSNMVSGELHAADPVDDINVYETVAGKRRGAGNIPISAGISGPMSLAVKLREGSLGQRRLKINDEPPHSSSGNWSASSESGRASVNSDSSHQPKSSTCSSILPQRRRFINNSTSSSVTSEGTLTPEDMAALPFADDGETSSVYSCDTEGYYTSFHMDSGLKTLKEEEVGSGFSLPPTPLHSTSALSNCSSGRGSASLAQLTAESEYELFGKGSTSTTASSAGTVCTTLLADHSRGGDNSLGSDRSLSKGPAVPERKSSLNVPCLAQECPPCSTVVALIHNSSQGHSPRSISGDSPDSGHNTSSSPIESMSSPQDAETDALISPIPSLTSEMEFSECSDFEGMDRIERIRVKTTINTSRIPSMCAITPPQSDDETSLRQFSGNGTADLPRAPAPLPHNIHPESNQNLNRNDNHSFNENGGMHLIDNNANKHGVDNNCNARPTIPLTNTSGRSIIHCDKNSGYATIQTLDNASKENNINQKARPPSPSGGTLFINTKAIEEESSFHNQPFIKDALIPFTSILNKFRRATHTGHNKSGSKAVDSTKEDNLDESGEYVTITDVKNNNKPDPASFRTPQRSEIPEPARESNINKTWESLEYVSLNEIGTNPSDLHSPDVLSGSSNESSLERRKRQGARVTLDSEGKVVYSSDSLRRRKGAHTTFAPGQYVKDPSVSPSPSPVANHRTPKAIIRPVQQQTPVNADDSWSKSPLKSNIRSSMSGTLSTNISPASNPAARIFSNELNSSNNKAIRRSPAPSANPTELMNEPQKVVSTGQLSDATNQKNRVIIRAGISSPTKEVAKSLSPMRSLSPRSVAVPRGAYVQMPPDRSVFKTQSAYLQTDFDGPEDSVKAPEGISPPRLFRDSLHHTYHPTPRSTEKIAASHPVYQNVSSLHREPSTNQVAAFCYQQRLQGAGTSPRLRAEHTNVMGQPIEAPLHSSTPTKPISLQTSPLAVGNTFSPIEKDTSQPGKRFLFTDSKLASIRKEETQGSEETSKQEGSLFRENRKSSLVSLPKTTMTSEELYAKIHKSKKQMNIKLEPEIVLSPTPSTCGSQSPISSERSASPNVPKGDARSRHSWSPNSSKYLDIVSTFDPRSNTPSPSPQVPKEHGLTQVTSTNDFKRLLLQHGSGSAVKSKLSAVERLKQAKQAATNVFSNNTAKLRFGSNSNGESTSNVPKLISHPQSSTLKAPPPKSSLLKPGPKYAWRFAGHKNDVRSTPIMEDQREYENVPVPDVLQIQTLSSSPMPARNFGRSTVQTRQFPQDGTHKTALAMPKTPASLSSHQLQPPALEVTQSTQSKLPPTTKQVKAGISSSTALETAL
ncbi:uncharacterized protein LOC117646937 [Thrips palmi]|uniref:Uncharacterized protein LOC117646937 n=1 Tax=Thrips palmi TaxID=161013 RepID=A0A6P8Z3C9_THRPL|nr:uncharacterized protein LOC117646937 [Thrips palmi]